jgi:hypothetical protein
MVRLMIEHGGNEPVDARFWAALWSWKDPSATPSVSSILVVLQVFDYQTRVPRMQTFQPDAGGLISPRKLARIEPTERQ